MNTVNVHLEKQQIGGLKSQRQRSGVPVNTLVPRAVAGLLADTEKHSIPAIVFDMQPDDAEPSKAT